MALCHCTLSSSGASPRDLRYAVKVAQPTREHMKQDVAAYMRYYNQERFHSSNGDMSPVNFENSQIKGECPKNCVNARDTLKVRGYPLTKLDSKPV